MLRVRQIVRAGWIMLALYGAQAAAQPTQGHGPNVSENGTPYDDLARRVDELRARVTGMQCISDELRREIGAVEGEVLKMNAKYDKATASKLPIDPDFVNAHDRMAAGVKAIRNAVAQADKICPPGPRGSARPTRPPQPPGRPPEQPSDTIVPQPKLAPADVVPTSQGGTSGTASNEYYALAKRLYDLQEKVRNSYCVTPELQKEVEDLRRDLDKATMGLDMKKPFDQYMLTQHEKLSRDLSDLDKAVRKLSQACPKTEKISPVDEQPPPARDDRFPPPTRPLGGTQPSAPQPDDRFSPPTTPLGGKQPVDCTEKERTDARLRLQDEVLKLEGELIRTHGTTPTGRARQTELQREIKHATDEMDRLRERCPYHVSSTRPKLPELVKDLSLSNQFVQVGEPRPRNAPEAEADECQAAEGIHPCTTAEEKAAQEKEAPLTPVRLTYGDLVHNLAYVKQMRSYLRSAPAELDKRLSEVGRLVESLAAYQQAMKQGRLTIDPNAEESFFEDVNGWLYELLNEIEEQPFDLSKIPVSSVLNSEQPRETGSEMAPVDPLIQPVYDMINAERASVGLPPLERDRLAEEHSQQHASEMAHADDLQHASRNGRVEERENIGKGLPTETPLKVALRWKAEKTYFRQGMYPDVCYGPGGPVEWYRCAHYTMMIWAITTKFGCAWARAVTGFIYVDCRFSPGGNKDDRPVGPAGPELVQQFKAYLGQHPNILAADRESYIRVLQPGYGNQPALLGGEPRMAKPPLYFSDVYSTVLPVSTYNPLALENGNDAVRQWANFSHAANVCDYIGMRGAMAQLKLYAQMSREHSVEEKSKRNFSSSSSYAAMANQIDDRVRQAQMRYEQCLKDQPERG